MPNGPKGERIWSYALGMLAEAGWILAMTVFAFLMAAAAIWWFR
jgi:hypothetical protein